MQGKRKDNRGRLLQKGESQRKDLIYQYRYTDLSGARRSVYAKTLSELRKKEKEIQQRLDSGLEGTSKDIKVLELVETYLSLKGGIRKNTMSSYRGLLNGMAGDAFLSRMVNSITMIDAKKWLKKMSDERGLKRGTVAQIQNIFRPAFQMAFNDMIINRNPFVFSISDIMQDDAVEKVALSRSQQERLLKFAREDASCKRYYDDLVILLGTGLRVSEFCGLTKNDIDFEMKCINVNHQLLSGRKTGSSSQKYSIQPPKTGSGNRVIPMIGDVEQSIKNLVSHSKEADSCGYIDGYSGFIVLGRDGMPKTREQVKYGIGRILSRYNEANPNDKLPSISPHTLRHTFCTNMSNSGMKVKTLQYIMGHSSAIVTLDVYSHVDINAVFEEMQRASRSNGNSEAINRDLF